MKYFIYEGVEFMNPDFRKTTEITPLEYHRMNNLRMRTREAIKAGLIKKIPCEICGRVKSIVHHEIYMDFLDVRHLCWSHHRLIHLVIKEIILCENALAQAESALKNDPDNLELNAKHLIIQNEYYRLKKLYRFE